jgi:diguanylate cyclase
MNAKRKDRPTLSQADPEGKPELDRLFEMHDREVTSFILQGLENCQLPTALFRPDDTIAYANDWFRDLFNVPPDAQTFSDIIRHCAKTGTGVSLSKGPEEWLKMAALKRRATGHRSFEIDTVDGRWFMVNETCIGNGWLWNIYTEITSLKSNENMLKMSRDSARRDADTDPLTGIFNRRHSIAELEKQVRQARVSGLPLSVALMDLDHFKSVNDTHGHLAGDAVLCHFSENASWLIRRTDTFARYGGEEFLLIMPGANVGYAMAILQRIREQIAVAPRSGFDFSYTFSAGISCWLEIDDPISLLRRADAALYTAKRNGRNRVEVADC